MDNHVYLTYLLQQQYNYVAVIIKSYYISSKLNMCPEWQEERQCILSINKNVSETHG